MSITEQLKRLDKILRPVQKTFTPLGKIRVAQDHGLYDAADYLKMKYFPEHDPNF